MFEEIYYLSKYKVEITAIENGWLVTIRKPVDHEEMMDKMVMGMERIANKGEEWNPANQEPKEKGPDKGAHFFKIDEPEKLLSFLSKLFLDEK